MRITWLVLLLALASSLALLGVSSSAKARAADSGNQCQHAFATSGRLTINSIVGEEDGAYVVAGSFTPPDADRLDAVVMRVSPHGVIEWYRTFEGQKASGFNTTIVNGERGFLLAGVKMVGEDQRSLPWLVSLDADGEDQWQHTVKLSNSFKNRYWDGEATDLTLHNDHIYVVGTTYGGQTSYRSAWVRKFTRDGDEVDEVRLGINGRQSLRRIKSDTDQDVIKIAGTRFGKKRKKNPPQIWTLDSELSEQDDFVFDNDDQINITDFTLGADGTGLTYVANGYGDIRISHLDGEGETSFDRLMGGPAIDQAVRLIPNGHGGHVIIGSTSSKGAGSGDIWLFDINDEGDLNWESLFGGKEQETAKDATQTGDGFLVAAQIETTGGRQCKNPSVCRLAVRQARAAERMFNRH